MKLFGKSYVQNFKLIVNRFQKIIYLIIEGMEGMLYTLIFKHYILSGKINFFITIMNSAKNKIFIF